VESPADGPVIVTFRDTALKQPDFFTKILAPLCLVNLIQREQSAHPENSGALTERIQLTLSAKLRGAVVCLLVRKDGANSPWQVFELVKGQEIGLIPAEALLDVDLLLEGLSRLIEQTSPQPPDVLATPPGDSRSKVESKRVPALASKYAKH
jgi:hypothetical protein